MPTPAQITTPPQVAALLERRRRPRSTAAAKLREVLRRVATLPEGKSVRAVWVYGSFARGAPRVGESICSSR